MPGSCPFTSIGPAGKAAPCKNASCEIWDSSYNACSVRSAGESIKAISLMLPKLLAKASPVPEQAAKAEANPPKTKTKPETE